MRSKKRQETRDKKETPEARQSIFNRSALFLSLFSCFLFLFFLSGCASAPKKPVAQDNSVETRSEQFDAAQKVVGAVAGGRDVTSGDMKRVVRDVRTNQETRSAVEKIIGTSGDPVVKYSPVTGKHYSGELEYDPETGAKLEVIKE